MSENDTTTVDNAPLNITSSGFDLRWQEEEAEGGSHVAETIGVVVFEDGLIPGFTQGVMIDTPFGPRAIETLSSGDLVLTRDHGPRPIRWISHAPLSQVDLSHRPDDRPIRIAANAIAPGLPERDIIVSPQHRFLIEGWKAQLLFGRDEVLVPAKSFVNDHSVRVLATSTVTYFHLLLDSHALVRANANRTESLRTGELDKVVLAPSNREGLLNILPNLRFHPRGFGPLARPGVTVREGRLVA